MNLPYYEITLTRTYHYRDDYNYDKSRDHEDVRVSESLEKLNEAIANWLVEYEPHPEDADTSKENYTTLSIGQIKKVIEEFEPDMDAIHALPSYVAFKAERQAEDEEEARQDAERAARAAARTEENERAQLAELLKKHGVPPGIET